MTERRSRNRLLLTWFCRISLNANRPLGVWKRIENISGTGMLMEWSRPGQESEPPRIGDRYVVEMQLPPHDTFGQRTMNFRAKVVRVFRTGDGRLMAGLETTRGRISAARVHRQPQPPQTTYVN
jgi:hypothetical protein